MGQKQGAAPKAPIVSRSARMEDPFAGGHGGYGAPDQPLGAYRALMSLYGVAFAGFTCAVRSGRLKLGDPLPLADILLIGIAAHKLARIIALDEVTSAVRAPFTVYEGQGDAPSELKERPRGAGMQKAIGTLVTCPYCLAPWVSIAGVLGLIWAPRLTKIVAKVFLAVAISDWLNTAYDHAWKSE